MRIRLLFAFLFISGLTFAQTSRQYSVLAWATVDSDPAAITLHFEDDDLATNYRIYRKKFGESGWGSTIATVASKGAGNDLSYEDKAVSAGQSYEYFIHKVGNGGFQGYGYVNAGVDLDATHYRGTLLLIIDEEASDSLSEELETLREDLSGDGYRVVDFVVAKTIGHEAIKDGIAANKTLYDDLRTVFIFGDVTVPYSGKYCNDNIWVVPPDGHKAGVGDHCGAWAADVFYVVPEGNWTDKDTVFFGASRARNQNDVGDGKYDQITLPGKVAYELGRVDLADLNQIDGTEMDLLRRYIDKNHRYRHRIDKPYMRSLIDENFNPSTEAFAGTGYRNFPAMVGRENVIEADFMNTLSDSNFIWAYGTGPGSFTSAGGIGKTTDFNEKQGAATFNFLFGSFFGDWDNPNAFLRAPLALESGGLTNAWAARPWWHVHPMAMDQTIGYCTKLVQNNVSEYQTGYFANNIHVALMGDPTLRMHMFAPPTEVQATPKTDMMKVDLTWTASTESVDGYNVYFSASKHGKYYKANVNLIIGTSYTHNSPGNGTFYYMVRAQRKETTLCGTFDNLSQGSFVKVDNLIMSSVGDLPTVSGLNVFPNPSDGKVSIHYQNTGNEVTLKVLDISGKVLQSQNLSGYGDVVNEIDLSHLSAGLYILNVQGQSIRWIKH